MFRIFNGVILLIFFVIGCTSSKKISESNSAIKAIDLIISWDLVSGEDGGIVTFIDTTKIIYYKDYILYQLPYTEQSTYVTEDKEGSVINERMTERLLYQSYVYKKGKKNGYSFDSLNATENEIFVVDSFLKERVSILNVDLTSLPLILIDSVKNNSILLEKYISSEKPGPGYSDSSFFDSVFMYYNHELQDIDFSFSKDLDDKHKMKLYKLEMIYNPVPKSKYLFPIPRRKYLYEIRKLEINNKEELLNFFNKLKT